MELLDYLDHPPREYTPIPFWFLNDRLEAGEIRRQLEDFCRHGVYGVVLHPRMGMDPSVKYLSEAFFEGIRAAVEAATKLDMRVVLYDEGMYPSGSACGLVLEGHPELASRGIALVDAPEPGDEALCQTARGCLVERYSGGTIRGIHFGEDDGEPGAPRSADILNPEAVDRFIELTHEAYYRHFAPHFGRTILGFFTDEPSILGRCAEKLRPWTRGFAKRFTDAGGRLENLDALFFGEENADTRLYDRMIQQLEGEVYYARLSRWCQSHGVWLMGHPHQSDDIEVERYFHVPGQDLVYRWVSPEKGGTVGMDSTMAKCAADAARLMGCPRNANECFGACNRDGNPWHFTGGDMKWFIDWLAVRGVNLFIPHAFYYSLAGQRSAERPPDVGPGSIWWPHYRRWSDYMTRLSWLMTDADIRAEIAVPCRNRALRWEDVAAMFETQRGFQYIPESLWGECREEDGALVCRGRRYRAVPEGDEAFPSVSRNWRRLAPDCLCEPASQKLRVSRFERLGRSCWLLVNEGEDTIQTDLTLPGAEYVGAYDLWNGRARRMESTTTTGGARLPLRLLRRQSLLLFACANSAEWMALKPLRKTRTIQGIRFTQASEEPNRIRKTYVASFAPCQEDWAAEALELDVRGEEMLELYVNGELCDVSFWGPHQLRIPLSALKPGENEFRIVATGSLANRYGREPVPYGLTDEAGRR